MTPIEIMALLVVFAAAIKILVILVNPKSWLILVKKFWSNSLLITLISLILGLITLYYLTQSGITIIEIFAVILFVALLASLSIVAYSKEMISIAEKLLKDKKILKKAWLPTLIWVILIIWALKELFM